MRFEATLSDVRGKVLIAMAEDLGMSRSQLLDEALALWLEVIEGRRRGARVVVVDPTGDQPDRELVTPSMAHLDWWRHRTDRAWTPEQLRRMAEVLERPGEPAEALRRLMAGEDVEGPEELEAQGIGG